MSSGSSGVAALAAGTVPAPERLATQELQLVVDASGRVVTLQNDLTRIGRSPTSDLVIDHESVSPHHAQVVHRGERFVLEALPEAPPLLVEGVTTRQVPLRAGLRIQLGEVTMRCQAYVHPVDIAPDQENRLGELVGSGVAMRQIFALVKRIAPSDSTVLLVGETGTGKGAAAKAIHALSPRAQGPLVVFDCAAIASTLIESELFGHEKGAFTGAVMQRIGCLERADGGTLFLDEIDDLALDLQPKLLRALEDRMFRRVGGSDPIPFNARIIAASKKDLWSEARAGRFREDLYFRLSVFTLNLPSLKDRREDLPLLVDAFGEEGLWERLPRELKEKFQAHPWPGNVRELRNAIERAKHLSDIPELAGHALIRDVPLAEARPVGETLPVRYTGSFKQCKDELIRSFEREYLTRLLAASHGNVAKAARDAEVDRKHLYSLLHKYGLVKDS